MPVEEFRTLVDERGAAAVYAGVVPGPPAGVAGPPPAGSQVPEGLVDALAAAIAAAPRARHELDDGAATADPGARRAGWLASTFALAGRRVLFLGDHDLTSLGLAAVEPRAQMAVADLDEDVLAHIGRSPLGGGRIACAWTDVRLGFAPRARGGGAGVGTPPPRTPQGIGLFA